MAWNQWNDPWANNPPPQGGGGGGANVDGNLVRDLIAAMGASIVNTNQNIAYLGQTMAQANAQARNSSGGDHGYRLLKPKKDITKITCDGPEELLVEIMQFEVDMGELGVHLYSEAAYRQLRAATVGKAREVLDLEQVCGGRITQLYRELNMAVTRGDLRQDIES